MDIIDTITTTLNMDITGAVLTTLAVLAASFSGAWFAHWYSSERDLKKKIKNDIYVIHYSLFILGVQLNLLKDILNTLKVPKEKYYPFMNHIKENLSIEYKSLTFILDTDDNLPTEIICGEIQNLELSAKQEDRYSKLKGQLLKYTEESLRIIGNNINDLKVLCKKRFPGGEFLYGKLVTTDINDA